MKSLAKAAATRVDVPAIAFHPAAESRVCAKASRRSLTVVTSSVPPFDSCTHLRIRKLSRLVSKRHDAELAPIEIKATPFSLMQHLGRSELVCASVLSAQMAMDPSTMTRGLRPLFEKGWVVQVAGIHSRQHVLRLTPEGWLVKAGVRWKAVQASMRRLLGDRPRQVFDHLLGGAEDHHGVVRVSCS